MLNGIREYNTANWAGIGATIGLGIGLVSVPAECGLIAITSLFMHQFFQGHSSRNVDYAFGTFQVCQVGLPIASATFFGLVGGVCGLIDDLSKQRFRNNPR